MSEKLCKVTTSEELLDIVGEFKSSYHEIGNLALIGMGCRTFQSSSGFKGTVVYLFDSKHQQWYTYSSVRPTYYDNSRNFYSAHGGNNIHTLLIMPEIAVQILVNRHCGQQ